MSMLLQIHPQGAVLNVVATGKFSLAEAKRTFLEMLDAAALHKSKKVLFDGRMLIGEPRFIERFYFGEFAADTFVTSVEKGVCTGMQFAYVLKEPLLDKGRFGETVAVNRGLNVLAFDNVEAALHWLGIAHS